MENQVETIVIGAGCAGLTAALQAREIGKKVMILEKCRELVAIQCAHLRE